MSLEDQGAALQISKMQISTKMAAKFACVLTEQSLFSIA